MDIIKDGFLATIRNTQPALWVTLQSAANEGLVNIDLENDAVSASNRLLWTYPGLHEAINRILNDWVEERTIPNFDISYLNSLLGSKESNM